MLPYGRQFRGSGRRFDHPAAKSELIAVIVRMLGVDPQDALLLVELEAKMAFESDVAFDVGGHAHLSPPIHA